MPKTPLPQRLFQFSFSMLNYRVLFQTVQNSYKNYFLVDFFALITKLTTVFFLLHLGFATFHFKTLKITITILISLHYNNKVYLDFQIVQV